MITMMSVGEDTHCSKCMDYKFNPVSVPPHSEEIAQFLIDCVLDDLEENSNIIID